MIVLLPSLSPSLFSSAPPPFLLSPSPSLYHTLLRTSPALLKRSLPLLVRQNSTLKSRHRSRLPMQFPSILFFISTPPLSTQPIASLLVALPSPFAPHMVSLCLLDRVTDVHHHHRPRCRSVVCLGSTTATTIACFLARLNNRKEENTKNSLKPRVSKSSINNYQQIPLIFPLPVRNLSLSSCHTSTHTLFFSLISRPAHLLSSSLCVCLILHCLHRIFSFSSLSHHLSHIFLCSHFSPTLCFRTFTSTFLAAPFDFPSSINPFC